jgi:predicted transposase YbfD/YdcC
MYFFSYYVIYLCNQEQLHKALNDLFSISRLEAKEAQTYTTSEKSHGRKKARHRMVADASEIADLAFEWAGLQTLGYVVSFRTEKWGKNNHSF